MKNKKSNAMFFSIIPGAGHKANQEQPAEDGTLEILKGFTTGEFLSKDLNKVFGYGLIILGVIALVERALFPLLADLGFSNAFRSFIYSFRNYLHTWIISAILIIVGLKLLSDSKIKTRE